MANNEDTTALFNKLKTLLGLRFDTDLARYLGLTPNDLSSVKRSSLSKFTKGLIKELLKGTDSNQSQFDFFIKNILSDKNLNTFTKVRVLAAAGISTSKIPQILGISKQRVYFILKVTDNTKVKRKRFPLTKINGPKVRLTEKRAKMLHNIVAELEEYVDDYRPEDQNDYSAIMQWMTNQVNKRWRIDPK